MNDLLIEFQINWKIRALEIKHTTPIDVENISSHIQH